MKASNLKSFALGFGIAISALGLYALAATLTTFKAGDVVSAQLINDNFAALNTGKQDRVAGTCAEGSSIRVIAADGTVTCQTDNGGAGSPFQFGASLNGSDVTKKGLTVTHTAADAFQATGKIGVIGKTTGADSNSLGMYAFTTNNAAIALRADASGVDGVAGEFNGNIKLNGKLNKKFSSTSATFSQATPIAYGSVNSDGSIAGGTPNFTVTRTAQGTYNIVIQGETYAFGTQMVTVTPMAQRMISVADGTGGGFKLTTFDAGSNQSDVGFTFMVYKP
jgi:hypothetical protein